MKTYRVGIIGCGKPQQIQPGVAEGYRIAYAHGTGYQMTERSEIVAVADIVQENAEAYAEHFQVPRTYSDYKKMLQQESLDIVSVCTWPIYHAQMVKDAAAAGVKGILCEKPMALNMEEVSAMIEACDRHGVVLLVAHQRRYHPIHQYVKTMIAQKAIGKVTRLEAWVGGGWDLMSWGTHWVDMLRFYLNDPEVNSVLAAAEWTRQQKRYGHPVEDEILLQIVFKGGEYGYIHLSETAPDVPGTLVIGTEGIIETNERGMVRLINHDGVTTPVLDVEYGFQNGYRDILLDLINSIETGQESICSAAKSAVVTEVIMAGYESAVTSRRSALPIHTMDFPLNRVIT